MKGYKDCERFVPSCPVQKTLQTPAKVGGVFWWGVISACNQKKVPPSMKEIIAEFNPHKGYTVSIRVVVPVARRVTGMFYGFLLGTVSHSKWRETDVRDIKVSLHDFGSKIGSVY